jgi:hypothetical protein
MTKAELKKAERLLGDYVDRTERAGIDGDGWCLTVYWLDGGQGLFYSFAQVEDWVAERDRYY